MAGFAVLLGLLALALGGGLIWVLNVAADAPDIDTLKPLDEGENTEVFAADGSSLGYVQNDVLREPVKLEEIPKILQDATIAIEDENFYEHGGVDFAAIVACWRISGISLSLTGTRWTSFWT